MLRRFIRGLTGLIFLFFTFWVLLGCAVYYQWASPWTVLITDPLVKWGTNKYAKPKIMKKIPLPASLVEPQVDIGIQQSLEAYYKLAPEDRILLLREGMIYAYYHWTDQLPPNEEIKDLMLFVDKQSQDFMKKIKLNPKLIEF
ncbi:MAG: hypothetical protein H7A32_03195 [Deltaproteobacteria bacterium]|nr:hypothetical protein [Deltaproteobacteria bacterium]